MGLLDFLKKPKSILEGIANEAGLGSLLERMKPILQQQYSPQNIIKAAVPPLGFLSQREQIGKRMMNFPQAPEVVGPTLGKQKVPIFGPIQQLPGFITQNIASYGRTLAEPQKNPLETAMNVLPFISVGGIVSKVGGKMGLGEKVMPRVVRGIEEAGGKATIKAGGKYAFNINVERMKITEGGEKVLRETVEKIKPGLEEIKGKPLKHAEVLEETNRVSMVRQVVTKETQMKSEAALLKLRQTTTSISNQIDKLGENAPRELWEDYMQNLKVLSSHVTEKGRALEALKIGAEDVPVREKFLQEIIDKTGKIDEIIDAAKGVNFKNALEATKFYRKFIKPSKTEILEWFRYQNMLSSPKTWIVNLAGNLLQFPLSTAEKLVSGGIDYVASALKPGRQRQYYVREVPHYVKGFLSGIPDAIKGFTDALTGKKLITRPDIKRVSPFTSLPARVYEAGTRVMEAGDMFFRGLFNAANKEALAYKYQRMGKEIAPELLTKQVEEETLMRLFRKPLKEADQGKVLGWIDDLTSGVYQLRKVSGVGWVVPFIQTPMNILKQGIEYSPAGFLTIPGAKEKIPQLSKALIGSTVFLGAMQLALEGKTTGKAPIAEKEKKAFYDSGRKPYTVEILGHWVSISKLGPIAYPIALAIMAREAFEENPSDSAMANLGRTLLGQLEFFSEQSYLEGINNVLQVAQGTEYAAKQFLASMAGQVIPERALLSWASRIIDDVYRQPKTFGEKIKSQLPFLTKGIEPQRGLMGLPSKRPYPWLSSFSPFDISPAVSYMEPIYQEKKKTRILKKEEKKRKEKEEEGVGGTAPVFRPKVRKGSPTRETRPFIMK